MKIRRLAFAPLRFLEPLAVIWPRKVDEDVEEDELPQLRRPGLVTRRDWSLTLIAVSYGFYMIVPVSFLRHCGARETRADTQCRGLGHCEINERIER